VEAEALSDGHGRLGRGKPRELYKLALATLPHTYNRAQPVTARSQENRALSSQLSALSFMFLLIADSSSCVRRKPYARRCSLPIP
jgi:hypothetical protein